MRRLRPYYCIAMPRELWFERLDFDAFQRAGPLRFSKCISKAVCPGSGLLRHSLPSGGMRGDLQGSASGMKMSKGQIGRRLLGWAVAGTAMGTCGTAFAEL